MLHKNIQTAREKSGLTKAEVARQLGIPYSTYDGYETGYREPRIDVLVQLSAVLKVDMEYLTSGRLPMRLTIGDVFKQIREAYNTTVEELALRTGLPEAVINAYESGEVPIPHDVQHAIIKALDVQYDDEGFIILETASTISLDGLSPDEVQAVNTIVRGLKDKKKDG